MRAPRLGWCAKVSVHAFSALTTGSFGNQESRAGNAGGVEAVVVSCAACPRRKANVLVHILTSKRGRERDLPAQRVYPRKRLRRGSARDDEVQGDACGVLRNLGSENLGNMISRRQTRAPSVT